MFGARAGYTCAVAHWVTAASLRQSEVALPPVGASGKHCKMPRRSRIAGLRVLVPGDVLKLPVHGGSLTPANVGPQYTVPPGTLPVSSVNQALDR
jgi:hypothetical protein